MDFSEKDIEENIIKNKLLKDYGVTVLANQFKTAYGIIDILGYHACKNLLVVVELKKGIIDENAVGQILRYMGAVKDLINGMKEDCLNSDIPAQMKDISGVTGILIGTSASDGVHVIIRNLSCLAYIQANVDIAINLDEYNYCRADASLVNDINYFIKHNASELLCEQYDEQVFVADSHGQPCEQLEPEFTEG